MLGAYGADVNRAQGLRGQGPVELRKLEALLAAIVAATTGPRPSMRLRRTLAGAVITLETERLIVERAPARRAVAAPRRVSKGPFTRFG